MQGQKPASYGALWPGYAENHFHFHDDELLQHRTSWWSEGWACRTSRSRRDAVATKVILDLSEVFQAGVQLGCLAEAQPRPPMTCCRLLWTKRFFLGATAHPLCCFFVGFFFTKWDKAGMEKNDWDHMQVMSRVPAAGCKEGRGDETQLEHEQDLRD